MFDIVRNAETVDANFDPTVVDESIIRDATGMITPALRRGLAGVGTDETGEWADQDYLLITDELPVHPADEDVAVRINDRVVDEQGRTFEVKIIRDFTTHVEFVLERLFVRES